ncbi:DUF4258 domain-containing protein [Francisellaceae bacterium]|nr:DUF4258 domain-containing protein [Francisellaceae bacterium]
MLKPPKYNDSTLYDLIKNKVLAGQYVIKNHARLRMNQRGISDLQVVAGLLGVSGYKRWRNKKKDSYEQGNTDWNYCIECQAKDENILRIIISFYSDLMPVITVMWLGDKNGN